MTDEKTSAEVIEYEERPEEELNELRKAAQQGVFQGYQYVAEPAPGYDVHGIWVCFSTKHRSGYATHGYGLAWILSNILKWPIQLIPHRTLDITYDFFPSDRKIDYEKFTKGPVGIGDLTISSFAPLESSFMYGLSDKLVTYSAHEGSSISPGMAELCNNPDRFTQVWVVSDFVRRSFVTGGVRDERIRVLPPLLCGGPWPIPDIPDVNSRPVTHDDPFTFGFCGTWHERKGFHDLIRAYFHTFTRNEPVRLSIRTSHINEHSTIALAESSIKEEIVKIAQTEFGQDNYPKVTTLPKLTVHIGTDLTDGDLIRWCGSVDGFANCSYGEGLGMPQHWAKAQGVPIVSTGYGAVGDLVQELQQIRSGSRGDALVPHQLEPISLDMLKYNRLYDRTQKWGKYDPKEFGKGMRQLFKQDRWRDDVGAQLVRDRYSVANVTGLVTRYLDEMGLKK